MKAFINSSKRINWFKVLMALITCLLFVVFPSCQKDEFNQDTIPHMDEMSSSASSINGNLTQGKVKDIDGNVYKKVKIGKQWWMAENLKTTHYNNGIPIPIVMDNSEWSALTTGAYCFFLNDEANKKDHGALYNWNAVNTGKLCPKGWHVPSDGEWHQLVLFLDPDAIMNDQDITRWESLIAGGKLKEEGTLHWKSPNYGATNESGFTALPGGVRNTGGSFRDVDGLGSWWTSTEYVDNPLEAWPRFMGYGDINVGRNPQSKKDGLSVRCLKDN
jgi:uncharacterized protein (TIGR02145 family)